MSASKHFRHLSPPTFFQVLRVNLHTREFRRCLAWGGVVRHMDDDCHDFDPHSHRVLGKSRDYFANLELSSRRFLI